MSDDDLQTDIIHPAEREILEELAEDFDVRMSREDLVEMANLFFGRRGRGTLLTSGFPGTVISTMQAKQPLPRDGEVPEKVRGGGSRSNYSPLEREVFHELDGEVKELEKESRRLPAVPSRRELSNLLETVREAGENGSVKDRRDYLILRLLYSTGCRRSELSRMLTADLYLDEQKIMVRDGKGNKDRFVLIDKRTADLLAEHTSTHLDETPVFDIGDRQINRRVVHWANQTGLVQRYEAQEREFTSHCLRHCFATHMYENGADLYTLRQLLGHKYLSTTKIYVSIGIGTLLSKYRSAHPLSLEDA